MQPETLARILAAAAARKKARAEARRLVKAERAMCKPKRATTRFPRNDSDQ